MCSSVRLILTNRRQRRIADNLLATERALRSSEEILSTAFRNSPDAFSINPFPNGPYLDVNEGYARLTGYSREEALGKTPRQMNLWVDFESRDQVSPHFANPATSAISNSVSVPKVWRDPHRPVSASIIDIQGQLCSLVIVRDITERKIAEDILRSSEERFRSLVSDFHFAVVLHSPDARIEFANRAAHQMFHKIMAGLLDAHQYCGNAQALDVLTNMANWAKFRVDRLTTEQMQRTLNTEQGGMTEVLANLYGVTGNTNYLQLAEAFNHQKVSIRLNTARTAERLARQHTDSQDRRHRPRI